MNLVRCLNCRRLKSEHEAFRWCGEFAPIKHSFYQPDDEQKSNRREGETCDRNSLT